jgi:predicted RNA-binding Zn-ribbon protein involved in translation (DUF1610 family)
MPHYKCAPCQTRLHAPAPDPGHHVCPDCGSTLEPVSDLSRLVGFRAVALEVGPERWLDDGDRSLPEAIAVALPPPE